MSHERQCLCWIIARYCRCVSPAAANWSLSNWQTASRRNDSSSWRNVWIYCADSNASAHRPAARTRASVCSSVARRVTSCCNSCRSLWQRRHWAPLWPAAPHVGHTSGWEGGVWVSIAAAIDDPLSLDVFQVKQRVGQHRTLGFDLRQPVPGHGTAQESHRPFDLYAILVREPCQQALGFFEQRTRLYHSALPGDVLRRLRRREHGDERFSSVLLLVLLVLQQRYRFRVEQRLEALASGLTVLALKAGQGILDAHLLL